MNNTKIRSNLILKLMKSMKFHEIPRGEERGFLIAQKGGMDIHRAYAIVQKMSKEEKDMSRLNTEVMRTAWKLCFAINLDHATGRGRLCIQRAERFGRLFDSVVETHRVSTARLCAWPWKGAQHS